MIINRSKMQRPYTSLNEKNIETKVCDNCKYKEKSKYCDSFKCSKNNFLLESICDFVCDYYEEDETTKIKKQCNFRRVGW